MEIRVAEAQDLDETMDLYDRASDAMAGTPHDAHWRRGLHPRREDIDGAFEEGSLLIGSSGDTIVAAAILDHDLDDAAEVFGDVTWDVQAAGDELCVLHMLVVDPNVRGQGLGRQLLEDCIRRARDEGCRGMRLDVVATNLPAISLYEQQGFISIGSGTRDVGDDGEAIDFVAMGLAL